MDDVFKEMIIQQLKDNKISIQSVTSSISTIVKDISGIKIALIGYNGSKEGGLISKVAELEDKMEKMDKLRTQLITAFVLIQSISGIVLAVLL